MKKKTVRWTERYVRESVEMLNLAERIKLKPRYLKIAYREYLRHIVKCIETAHKVDPKGDILVVAGEKWPVTFIVRLEAKANAI